MLQLPTIGDIMLPFATCMLFNQMRTVFGSMKTIPQTAFDENGSSTKNRRFYPELNPPALC